jgi:hypothetical protein
MGVPVRISNSGPRFKTRYNKKNMEKIPQLYPDREIFRKGLKPEEFRTRYRAQLHRVGIKEIQMMIDKMQARHPGERLVLLCFEKVLDGEYCHRRVFAEWYYEETGVVIGELVVDVNTAEVYGFTDDLTGDVTKGMEVPHHNRGLVGPLNPVQEELM